MYCSTTAIQESVAFSSDTVTGLRLQHPQLAAVGSATVVAVAPSRGGFGSPRKVNGFARGSPTRGAVERSETERLYEGKPDREPLLDSTSPSALTRCHLPYRGEALAFRKAWPLRQRFPY